MDSENAVLYTAVYNRFVSKELHCRPSMSAPGVNQRHALCVISTVELRSRKAGDARSPVCV